MLKISQLFSGIVLIKLGLYDRILQEHDRYALWIPLGLAAGIYSYVIFPWEPGWLSYTLCSSMSLLCIAGAYFYKTIIPRSLCFIGALLSTGFLRIAWKAEQNHAVLLKKELGPFWIKGKVSALDHTATSTGKIYPRVWLRELHSRKGPLSLPCLRMGIRTKCDQKIVSGDWVEGSFKLIPWRLPIIPGGYDAQFQQFFQGVSAYGFSVSTIHVIQGKRGVFTQLRQYLTESFHQKLPYPLGAVASALITGDKTALPAVLRQDFSVSGLSHILAISGLHLSIVSAICFFVFQTVLRWIPRIALRVSVQTVSGVCALIVGFVYACISGLGYPVQRSFILMAATLVGVLLNRNPSSTRLLALCGAGILLIEPQACFSLSFQLSFIATASLMTIPKGFWGKKRQGRLGRWSEGLLMMNITTISATLSTLPWIAFYFHQYSLQSVISNLFAVSWTSFCVMPLGLLAIFSLMTPCSDWAFLMWGIALKGLVWIAQSSAHYLDFLLFHCPLYSKWIFFTQVFLTFWWLIWQGSWRWWGMWGVFALSVLAHFCSIKPQIIAAFSGEYVGIVDQNRDTLWITNTRKEKFALKQWLTLLNLKNLGKERDITHIDVLNRLKLAQCLKKQYPDALGFCQSNAGWKPLFISDQGRSWRIFPKLTTPRSKIPKKFKLSEKKQFEV